MKNFYLKIADKILPKFSEVCGRGKCKHTKCKCGHCQRNYHVGKIGECTKIHQDLNTCKCKKFELSSPPQSLLALDEKSQNETK